MSNHGSLLSLALLPLLAASASAQTKHVVPTGFGYESSGGSTAFVPIIAGSTGVRNLQVIAADSVGFKNESITEVALRFSSFWNQGWEGTHQIRISMGTTSLALDQLPTAFDLVPDAPLTEVFNQVVTVPASTSTTIPEPWSLVLPLSTPWVYDAAQGSLVIEFESQLAGAVSPFWPADVHTSTPGGSGFQILGTGCNGLMSQVSTQSDLVPGGTAEFRLERFQIVNMAGSSFICVPAAGFPLELGIPGIPGCVAQGAPIAQKPASIEGSTFNATGKVEWEIPASPALAGASFIHQTYLLPPFGSGAAVSTAHLLRIGSATSAEPPVTQQLRGDFGDTTGTLTGNPTGWILRLTTE